MKRRYEKLRKLMRTLILIAIGAFMIPALYALAITLFGTVLGFMANPRVMLVLIGIFAVISVPGAVIAWVVKKVNE